MDLNKLDLNLLLIFLAVYRKRSATLAGEELGLTQSSVSNGLRRLRKHLSDPLFVRSPHGLEPTLLADTLAEPIQDAVDRIEHALKSAGGFEPRESERKFRLYLGDMGQLVMMPGLLQLLEAEAPRVSISVVDTTPREAQHMMSEGKIDLAFGALPFFEGNFHRQRLFRKNFVVMGRAGHPALEGTLTAEKFFAARHATFKPPAGGQTEFENWLDGMFRAHKATRRVVVELAHGLGVVETIAASNLLICVPQRMAEMSISQETLQFQPLPFDYPAVDICQFWHHRQHADAGHRWLRNRAFQIFFGKS